LVNQLVGDSSGVDEKYALICRHCYAHNGLVFVDEINDIQYNCPKCGKFNPSNRALRAASAAPLDDAPATGSVSQQRLQQPIISRSSRSVEHSDQGESGTATTHSRGEKSSMNAQYEADGGDDSDSGADIDTSKVNVRTRRPGRAARDHARPLSAASSDTDGHDVNKPKPRQPEQPPAEAPLPQPPSVAVQQQQQQKPQKTTPKKRKGAKAKRSL
ncbi:hypothetical protein IWW38_001858, partial [Coemansia aciculifera]